MTLLQAKKQIKEMFKDEIDRIEIQVWAYEENWSIEILVAGDGKEKCIYGNSQVVYEHIEHYYYPVSKGLETEEEAEREGTKILKRLKKLCDGTYLSNLISEELKYCSI